MKIRRTQLSAGVPAVAMADIAFNLVLFFIILAKSNDDSNLQWQPAKAAKVEANEQSRITVGVDKDGKVYLNGDEKGIGELTAAIDQMIKNDPSGRRTVLLKIHFETLAAKFEPIIEAVSEAGGDVVHVLEDENLKK